MDRSAIQKRLAETEEQIASGQHQVAQQRELIVELEANGRSAAHAKYLLAGLELLQAARRDSRDWLMKRPAPQQARRRFAGIRREIDSLVEDFFRRPPSSTRRRSFLHIASRRARAAFGAIPAVHFTETDRAYEITSELPSGMDEKNVEVKFAKGVLTIKGEKQEEREEKKKVSDAGA